MGQEAVSTGLCSVLQRDDLVAATYRGHAASLALGTDPFRLLAEMLGREPGVCGGRAGSMNIIDREHQLVGCFGIVGGSIAAATGVGLALKQKGAGVAIAIFGDGAVNSGYFHECLNFACVTKLPIVYICENNQYAEFSSVEAMTAGGILPRARAFGIKSEAVDGMDVWAVREAAYRAVADSRSGNGPSFLEARTYRYNDHARGDPLEYRREGEMEAWRDRDPLLSARKRLVEEYKMTVEELDDIQSDVSDAIDAVRLAALDAPKPHITPLDGLEFKSSARATNRG
jgi:TPP-dependent pyruvate/acetoin dehydrogenase alpha subunit